MSTKSRVFISTALLHSTSGQQQQQQQHSAEIDDTSWNPCTVKRRVALGCRIVNIVRRTAMSLKEYLRITKHTATVIKLKVLPL